MAQVFPRELPDYVKRDQLRSAERKVFAALAQLPESYVVLYSRPWIGTNPDGSEKDGEADFVVATPGHGLLLIEVKGGTIGYDATKDQWTSVDREKRRHRIKDPVRQATTSKHALIERLRRHPRMPDRFIPAAIGVVFPDSASGDAFAGASGAPIAAFAFAEDMPRLADWVEERMKEACPSGRGRLGQDGIAVLIEDLAPTFQLRTPLWVDIDRDDETLVTLTSQQFHLLAFLGENRQCAIGGPAGCGKTMLAVEKARRLAAGGSRVLLTCYNAPLAAHLKRSLSGSSNLVVGTFHEICGVVSSEAGVPVSPGSDAEFFKKMLPDAFLAALEKRPDLRFDAVVVDEGQDFDEEWFAALQLALTSKDGTFWVFFDDNQRLYPRLSRFLKELPQPPFRMTENVRNTQAVFGAAQPFLDTPGVQCLGPDGRPVEELSVQRRADLPASLGRLLDRLVEREGLAIESISVLAESGDALASMALDGRLGRYRTCSAEDPKPGCVLVDSVRRFKGLERSVVIVITEASLESQRELAYVAFTRARAHLIHVSILSR